MEDNPMVQPHVKQAMQDFFNSLRACIWGEGSDFNYVLPKKAL